MQLRHNFTNVGIVFSPKKKGLALVIKAYKKRGYLIVSIGD
jgi:hypothetical protein